MGMFHPPGGGGYGRMFDAYGCALCGDITYPTEANHGCRRLRTLVSLQMKKGQKDFAKLIHAETACHRTFNYLYVSIVKSSPFPNKTPILEE
jgi:hypothetical protein